MISSYAHVDTEGTMQGFPQHGAATLRACTAKQLIFAGGIREQAEGGYIFCFALVEGAVSAVPLEVSTLSGSAAEVRSFAHADGRSSDLSP